MITKEPGRERHRVAAIYLARMAEGLEPLQRFVRSYALHAAGVRHDLVVIYKGFDQIGRLETAKGVLSVLPHAGIEVSDAGFDIGAYLQAASALDHDYACFMNTFTEIEADGWLEKLYTHASSPGIGIVGAMGSYESLRDSSCLIHKVLWLCNEAAVPYNERIAHYYSYIVSDNCVVWNANGKPWMHAPWQIFDFSPRQIYHRLKAIASPIDLLRRQAGLESPEMQFRRKWRHRVGPRGDLAEYAQFAGFPNPHIRSNGFMVARSRILEFAPERIRTKLDACAFESGPNSLTSRIRRDGLEALVVDDKGVGYPVHEWWRSQTFRLGNEENLLLSDNQSRSFQRMDSGAKATHMRITWGDYLGAPRSEFPDFGFYYPIDEEITGRPQPRVEPVASGHERGEHP